MTEKTEHKKSRNTFRKPERLCSRKEIERLFAGRANTINVYPLKLMSIKREVFLDVPAKTMFVVPKRNFRKAHDRNRLRRRMRECFRLQKNDLYTGLIKKQQCLSMALLYTGKKEEDFETIKKALMELLSKLSAKA